MPYILDTNIFNKLIDGLIQIEDLPIEDDFIATHLQIDELNNTPDTERRARLFLRFAEVRPRIVPTESLVFGCSRWGSGKFSDGSLFNKLKNELDDKNNSKQSNIRDALIAEVAITNNYTLLTADRNLATITQANRGQVKLFEI